MKTVAEQLSRGMEAEKRLYTLLNSIAYHRPEFTMPDGLHLTLNDVSKPLE